MGLILGGKEEIEASKETISPSSNEQRLSTPK